MRQTTQVTIASSLFFALLLSNFSSALAAQPREGFLAEMGSPTAEPPRTERMEYAYGGHPLPRLDFSACDSHQTHTARSFVHSGGWQPSNKKNAAGVQKIEHLTSEGLPVPRSITDWYRPRPRSSSQPMCLRPSPSSEPMVGDGGDVSRIVLMGYSAGAYLVALVDTDARYLAAAGLSLSDIRGVIALGGASYDIVRQIAESGRFIRETYIETFGSDPARQRALSPTIQAATHNAPEFLIAHSALVQAGTSAEVHGVVGKSMRGHLEINRLLGTADYPATAVVDTWLRKLLR